MPFALIQCSHNTSIIPDLLAKTGRADGAGGRRRRKRLFFYFLVHGLFQKLPASCKNTSGHNDLWIEKVDQHGKAAAKIAAGNAKNFQGVLVSSNSGFCYRLCGQSF